MLLQFLVLLHVLGACVWAGGHLILATTILPKAWKDRNPDRIKQFEHAYEKIGIPSLIIQVITGIGLASVYLPASEWFSFESVIGKHIGLKFILLFMTILLAIHARFFIIPRLSSNSVRFLGTHIIAVTIIAVLLVLTGVSYRMGILF